ncbi:MAG: type 1 glutamine amidotransferase [Bacteroidetes bacterium]|nr:type 1 glutamine amidotransferase [Bacteroidota bacterium]
MNPILLIQARDEAHILAQEHQCFTDRLQVEPALIVPLNVLAESLDSVRPHRYSAIMIGGSGAYSAAENYHWMDGLLEFVRTCISESVPTFGSCWGHQIIARAAGGTVAYDPARSELGSVEIQLTDTASDDDLFRLLPPVFCANAGHHDRVLTLPEGAIELARNESQPYQAFRMKDLPVYGTQFHSELDAAAERERLYEYREHYRDDLPSEAAFQRVIDSLHESTEADKLLRYFLDAFVL